MAVIAAVLLAAVAAWLLWPRSETAAPPAAGAPPVRLFKVDYRDVVYRSEALGSLRAAHSVEISPTVTETVVTLHFRDGDRVPQGAVLAVLAQHEEQAALAEARSNLAEQERELSRLEDLVRTRAVPQSERDQRRTLRDRALHQIAAAEARIADRTLRAPFAGQLGLRRISPGALVSPGTVITTLDDLDTLHLDFSVPEALLASVAEGQVVEARSAAFDEVFQGRVLALDTRISPLDRSLLVRAAFANPGQRLKPGMLMQVALLRDQRRGLVVPEESLVAIQDRHAVWRVDRKTGQAHQQRVTLGAREPGWAEITDGLVPGDWIVREGLLALREGLTVRVIDSGAD